MGEQAGFPRREGRTCHNAYCDFTTDEPLSECPKCGRWMVTDSGFRNLGWLMMAPGFLLAAGGAALIIFAAPRMKGGFGMKVLVYGVFGGLLLVGLAFTVSGLMQALSGRKNSTYIAVAVVLLAVIGIIVAIARVLS